MKVVVNRSKWSRGRVSNLLDAGNGKMCCLGFVALGCGYSEDDILGEATPGDVTGESLRDAYNNEGKRRDRQADLWPGTSGADAYDAAMFANDDSTVLSDSRREEELINILAPLGIELEFIDSTEAV